MQEHLIQHNGRFCVTSNTPNGTYAYFLTFEEGNQTHQIFYIFGPETKQVRETQTVVPVLSELDPDVLWTVSNKDTIRNIPRKFNTNYIHL